MKNFFRFLPNLITLLNLSSGVMALIFALEGSLAFAGVFILVASLFDFLDGFFARLLKAGSDLGKQLDSLADVVSFGVAPGMIAFMLMKKALPGMNLPLHMLPGTFWYWLLILSPLMIPAFSALRLAKFNIDTRQTVNFLGMPTPANAILWASFALIAGYFKSSEIPVLLFTSSNLLITIVITSLLLVSELPVFSLKFQEFSLKENWYRYLFLAGAAILLITMKLYGLPLVIILYIALSLALYILKIDI